MTYFPHPMPQDINYCSKREERGNCEELLDQNKTENQQLGKLQTPHLCV